MSVDPLKTNPPLPTDASRLGAGHPARRSEAQSSHPAAAVDSATPGAGDRVQLSQASRTLIERAEEPDPVPHGTISFERTREVLRRLESDYYGGDGVRDIIARGVRADLGLSTSE